MSQFHHLKSGRKSKKNILCETPESSNLLSSNPHLGGSLNSTVFLPTETSKHIPKKEDTPQTCPKLTQKSKSKLRNTRPPLAPPLCLQCGVSFSWRPGAWRPNWSPTSPAFARRSNRCAAVRWRSCPPNWVPRLRSAKKDGRNYPLVNIQKTMENHRF